MVNSFENIPQMTLESQVLERLRDAIMLGHFQPGSQLNQVQIAYQLGVSRGPVRAALNKLEKEGLVINLPHRGTFVTTLEKKSVHDLYCVRAVLEGYAVRQAVEHCSQEDIQEYTHIVSEMRAAARQADLREVIRLDFRAHEFFVNLSGNSFLVEIWSTIKAQVWRVLSFRHRSYPNLQEIADSHLPFIELMKSKNADEAARTMEAHIQDALTDLMERWNNTDTLKGALS
jgi:DNA-binding GntR family transcriptional regulator